MLKTTQLAPHKTPSSDISDHHKVKFQEIRQILSDINSLNRNQIKRKLLLFFATIFQILRPGILFPTPSPVQSRQGGTCV
jgi:hypothetical protein